MKRLNQKGFTLVELMVVVAIIGILSAIAIPNFKKYQAKSKQSEGKLVLAGIYTVQTAAYGEYEEFFDCLEAMGYDAGTPGFYSYGMTALAKTTGASNGAPAGCTGGAFQYSATKGSGGVTSTPGSIPASAATTTTFDAGAAGQVMSTMACDLWTIDEAKTLTNTQAGILAGAVCT